ncbi:hypothetical protein CRN80_19870 [Pseudomonas sp. FDAARGOS_380]|uniref:hypothetical protein n=1 Tax=Pseudomonas sp. FDAARGOS_380 TaxID=2018067 RepID=UPI00054C64C2|nr:hypothetical protein [Pseudomonas sp. FDAARGOS_380]ATN11757.1 hypothetical protein CRN80_19870 [Pseudomonas sp. FDAARGOS_380]
MNNKNPTFRGAEPTWANACVGNNGQPSYVEYSEGFSKAANILIDLVINDRSSHFSVDEFVYPVCFNMRHSVELRLKGAIDEIIEIAKLKKINLHFNSSSSHDINIIWSFFKTQSENIDKRYIAANLKVEATILDIAEVDPTGQTFRYPFSNDSQKHLTEVSVINFILLKKKFNDLEKNLESLHKLNNWLRSEYNQGSFTEKLSRLEIFRIAKELPRIEKWRDEEFTLLKDRIKAEYGLGSRDFSKVVDIIKTHYNLAPMINSPLPLKGISEKKLFQFIDEWFKENPDFRKDLDKPYTEIIFDKESLLASLLARGGPQNKIWDIFITEVNAEYLAGLETLFYFARDREFVEYYDRLYDIHLAQANANLAYGSDLKDDFMHIFSKSNAIDNLLISLFSLQHTELAESIIGTYGLEGAFKWLDDARSGRLFAYPDLAGY